MSSADLDGRNGFDVIDINAEDRAGYFFSGAGDFYSDRVEDFLIGAPCKTVGSELLCRISEAAL